jgi:hypothetical protein
MSQFEFLSRVSGGILVANGVGDLGTDSEFGDVDLQYKESVNVTEFGVCPQISAT